MLTAETTHQGYKPPIYTVLKELGAMEEKLAATIRALEETNKKLEATEKKLSTLNSTVTKVKAVDKGQPRVAFSASLQINGNIGPVNIIYPLVYRNVLSNIGGHYSPHTGYFTAPVRGVYYFAFTSICWASSESSGGSLYKNGKHIVSWYGFSKNHPTSGSNSAILMLQAGDMVNVHLWSKQMISDNENNYSTFSGFLLFPM
ncbi:Complement C1q-like protein 2 C1q and tumor necrosis factor-related protein 10 [Channa argus]|uniref:Complement C1q-like protein 2 C1q and tumor necrosis factor-related protein 10 n=1 Tax=Channa argus TaxID=215402 RepID=A0A6G1Q5Q4_CHAAH|nr:Complement C1q-like protein 2 C1q and tumor necrosis factor-related protein 10 [Channa argus]